MRITVDLRELDDEAAYRIVDAENRGRSDFSPIERARLFEKAIAAIYYTEPALAEAYGLHKSTVNRLMAIIKLPSSVMSLIADHHEISARQASEFMNDWGSPLQEKLEETIEDMRGKHPASAATVFKALKLAIAPRDEVEEAPVLYEEVSYGSIRKRKQGGVRIDLLPSRGEISLKALVTAVGQALKKLNAEG
jgi:ParB-like chromosome segregation protein Spo0J